MARETKVGLLAGLAFIVCFAVILANRGRNGPPGLSNTVLTDAALNVPAGVQGGVTSARNPQNAAPVDRRRAASPSHAARPPASQPPNGMPARLADSTPVSGAELPVERNVAELSPRVASNAGAYPVGNGRDSQGRAATDPNHEVLERVLASHSQPSSAQPDRFATGEQATPNANSIPNAPPVFTGRTMQADSRGDARPAASPTDQTARGPGAASAERAAPRGKEYTVQASDTLSSIAASNYGTKSRTAVKAIFDANRGLLSDPDHLKVGMVIVIPALASEGRAEASNAAAAQSPPVAEVSTGVADRGGSGAPSEPGLKAQRGEEAFRWYQVKKKDRYASIAKQELGDEGRWKELYELNKDKFPDPQRIREGVRIKLPVAVAEGGRENRR